MYIENIKHNICIFAMKISKLIDEHAIIKEKNPPYLYQDNPFYGGRT